MCEEIAYEMNKHIHSENLDMHLKNANGLSNLRPQGWLYIHNGHRGGCTIKNVSKKLLMATRTVVDMKWLYVGWV